MGKRILVLAAALGLLIPSAAFGRTTNHWPAAHAASGRHSCSFPKPGRKFFFRLQASRAVSCRTVRIVLGVWNHQEFPPFIAAGRKWWEYRKPYDNERRMYTLLHSGGGRSIYMYTLAYG